MTALHVREESAGKHAEGKRQARTAKPNRGEQFWAHTLTEELHGSGTGLLAVGAEEAPTLKHTVPVTVPLAAVGCMPLSQPEPATPQAPARGAISGK